MKQDLSNIIRENANLRHLLLKQDGGIMKFWECELKPKQRERTLDSIAFTLNHIWLQDHGAKAFSYPEVEEEGEDYLNVAEKET